MTRFEFERRSKRGGRRIDNGRRKLGEILEPGNANPNAMQPVTV